MVFNILSLIIDLFYLYWVCIGAIEALIDGCNAYTILMWAGLIWVCANSTLSDITYLKI